ncbi:nuclear transport factor 2 family protein [Chryseosolibacter indicus]|uniref:Nuclear transport factor 2 family protein n=1 Tax=Chryseosolibacter indicus TaxID=2782351 RepID=A0ABS5VSL1_9BACT|nr:nuclear transport factor 2 family protein [Chryseosolibacter indicus]MBT1703835.1 nuclear transport factor 2 family protein [Chryseosolibacter indicus]
MTKIIPCLAFVLIAFVSHAQNRNKNLEATQHIFEAFNAHKWEQMLSYYSKDAVFHDASLGKPIQDPETILKRHQHLEEYFNDIRVDLKSIYPSGENVIIEFVSTGTSVQGEKLNLPICTILTFKDGKVVRDATYYDNQ